MKLDIVTLDNKSAGSVDLNKDIFGLPVRVDILHQVVNWQLAKRRAGTQKVKTRSEVHGTTKKPFAQKGTGNARQGSLKGPHQRGGGVAHAMEPRSYAYNLNKKVRIKGLKTALSLKAAEGLLKVIDTAVIDSPKLKDLKAKFDKLGVKSALIVRGSADVDNFSKAAKSMMHIDIIPQFGLNVYDILRHENLVITKHALEDLQKRLAAK
jgi:large subunit ribosomal protein L4